MSDVPAELRGRLGRVRLLALDVDGVLTDGTLYYGEGGDLLKGFHAHDGLGLQLLLQAGIHVAVVSGRSSGALAQRAADLGIAHLFQGVQDKRAVLAGLARELGVSREEVAFAGDDLPDVAVFREVGIAIAVRDAHPLVRARACWVTQAGGGRGAVREIADAILASQSAPVDGACAFRVAIPARYASTRLPGKPLRELAGRPLIAHVWERAVESGAQEIVVATDDARIQRAVQAFGGRALLTGAGHASGTDRIAEVADLEAWPDDAIVINLQGDEPFLGGHLLRRLAQSLHAHESAGIATLATPIQSSAELYDATVVKVVLDDASRALYFSRAPVPWVRGAFELEKPPPGELPAGVPFLRHLGIYAYRAGVLRRLRDESPRSLEHAEALEQLRALSLGIAIHVEIVEPAPERGVDTAEDLERADRYARSA